MKTNYLLSAITIILTGVLSSACSNESEPEENIVPNSFSKISLGESEKAAADKLEDFYTVFTKEAVKLTDKSASSKGQNIVVSPVSMAFTLSMLANGIDTDGQKQIAEFLGVEDLGALNKLAGTLIEELPKSDNQTKLLLANSVWVNNLHTATDDFTSLMGSYYQSPVHHEDFRDAGITDKVNGWCSDKTEGLVPKMFDKIDEQIIAIFLNAMYFKGKWEKNLEFKPGDTARHIFHGVKGDSRVDMMKTTDYRNKYYRDDNFESFIMNFGNSAFYMTVVLPKEGLSLDEANSLISSSVVGKAKKYGPECILSITIPKFKVKNHPDMNSLFENCGLDITSRFVGLPMLKNPILGNVNISQGASFEMNESGAEAAAVSEANVSYIMCPPVQPSEPAKIDITVDRPFYFFINEVSTGACILSGRIADL